MPVCKNNRFSNFLPNLHTQIAYFSKSQHYANLFLYFYFLSRRDILSWEEITSIINAEDSKIEDMDENNNETHEK